MSDMPVDSAKKEELGHCREESCTVATSGECYEGLPDLSACPNFFFSNDPDLDETDDSFDEPPIEVVTQDDMPEITLTSIDLYSGKELDYTSSLRITCAALTRVIVLAGPNDSGKTTLLASIYEHFLKGPVGGYLFAGSETLPAFDYRCHLSRTDSNRKSEHTERTKSFSEETMLHLRVRDEALEKPPQDLLFSDIRGELFKDAINSEAEAQRIEILKRADHLALLVDGAKIASLKYRNQATTSVKMMLRSFIEAKMIGRHTVVEVLFTKDDLIRETEVKNETADFLKITEDEIRSKYENYLAHLDFHRIAARIKDDVDSYGLPKLFSSWVEESAYLDSLTNGSYKNEPQAISSVHEFDRFALKHLPANFIEKES